MKNKFSGNQPYTAQRIGRSARPCRESSGQAENINHWTKGELMTKQFFRRAFIALLVISAALLLFPCPGSAWKTIPGNDIEKTCGLQNIEGKKILVVYDTKYGATRTIADKIQEVLCAQGAQVDMSLVKRIQDLEPYDAVIIGSAIINEQWRPDMLKFLKAQQDVLAAKPVAIFIVCGLMKDDTAKNRQTAQKYYIDAVLTKIPGVVPVGSAGLFAGIMDFSVLTPVDEFLIRALFGGMLPEGDYRNFDKVTQWTNDILPLLK
jgi:menaquinone-dependent protoporphyrinogen IX oxidase